MISKNGNDWNLSRKIIVSRQDLLPNRQIIYDKNGNVATDARYDKYNNLNGINFPTKITITRPQEEYDIILDVTKARFNEPLKDEQFQLAQPPGSQLVRLDLPETERMEIPQPQRPKKNEKKGSSSHGTGAHGVDDSSSSPNQTEDHAP